MSKKNNAMDQQSLKEEYEEIKFKLLMTHFADWEGKLLSQENEELSKDPFYHPSEKTKRIFENRLNRQISYMKLRKTIRLLHPIHFRKLAFVLPLLIILLLTTSLTVEAVRVKVFNMLIQVESEYTKIRFGEDPQSLPEPHLQVEWDDAYVPMKIPKGFRIANVTNDKTMKLIEYENGEEGYIMFQQNNENSGLNVDTEEADEVISITVKGKEGLLVRKNDVITVVWEDNARLFLITGKSANLSKDELIEMAESMKLLK